jgi:small GTP-binding protein
MNLLRNHVTDEAIPVTATFPEDIQTLKKIAGSLGDQPVIQSLNELSAKLEANRFYLVIVGLFKRGKSSLINALIGKELAPVAVTPLTSVITFFEYSPGTTAEVFFEDGRRVPVSLPEVAEYISEEENPENKKQVYYLRIHTNAPVLENIVLVDTPGLGSLFSHNSETTLKFLPKIDAALFVLSADIPVSKTDKEFLLQMKNSIPNVLFVLNKSDLLSSSELDKMIRYNLGALNKIFGNEHAVPELIPVSARDYFMKKHEDPAGRNG